MAPHPTGGLPQPGRPNTITAIASLARKQRFGPAATAAPS